MRYQIFSDSNCSILNINCIGFARDPKITRFGPGRRDAYIIHYVLSGKGFFNDCPVSSGQGFIITPHMSEKYIPDRYDPWAFLWIISRDEKMADLLQYYHADKTTHIFQYDFPQIIQATADMLITNSNTVYHAFEMLEIFLKIFKNHQTKRQAHREKNANIYTEAAVNYIKSNLANPITVKELTGILGISQPYLYQIFKDTFGKSPKQYISDYKLTYAKKLLTESDMTITQIAFSVGFCDVLCFSKFFSSKTGISPQHYRIKKALCDPKQ